MRLLLGCLPLLAACGSSSGGDGDADSDADTDADTDTDTGTDSCDADGDGARSEACAGDDCDDAAAAVHPGAPDSEVRTETVDGSGRTGWYTSIAIGPRGELAISYLDVSRNDLRVASLVDGVWTSESPDTEGTFGDRTSAAFDSTGALHVSYGDGTTVTVRHATNAGGVWGIEPVATDAIASSGRGIAVGADDVVHVAYTTATGVLTHASNPGGVWANEEIDRFGFPGRTALAIDGDGTLHAAYAASNHANYATNASGAWTTSTVTAGEQTSNVGLGVDASGAATVVYWDFDTESVRTRSGAGFTMEEIYPGFGEADELSVAADEAGNVHVCIAKESGGGATADLVYLTNARGAWETLTLDEGTTGYYCSIAVRGGAVHVAYFDDERGVLRHAVLGVPDGVDSDCDGEREGDPRAPRSGLDGARTLGELTVDDWRTFCEWSATFQGGEGTTHECPDGTVTVATVAECIDDSAAFADCALPVADAETCIRAQGDDPCEGFSDPACSAMLACVY